MVEEIEGYVAKIIYHNDENGYSVISLQTEEDEMTCVGTFPFISEGEFLVASGSYTDHPVYGAQFMIENYDRREPEDLFSIEMYLGSGALKGIGPVIAKRIVKRFKADTLRIMEEEPERLSEVKGISERIARDISIQFDEKRDMRNAMIFLQKYNITGNLAVKIFQEYGNRMNDIIKENPYRLAEDISGVGFKTADEIARRIGIGIDSDYRIKAGVLYTLLQASNEGHIYLPEEKLYSRARTLLNADEESVNRQLMTLNIEKKIIIREVGETNYIYSASFYYMELNIARMLHDLNIPYKLEEEYVRKHVEAIEDHFNIQLEELQRRAVIEAAANGLLIITGGPGTGKTTTINAIIKLFEKEGMDILLAAPTGRAAKRMTETTGYEAKTIHRLLELSKLSEGEDNHYSFERNEINPLETDILIIDEMSMVDIALMNALLKAVSVGTRLILVGDVNQLPSVGPGNILKDIIESNCFNVVKLDKIFRQAADSDIIVNAHKINAGEHISLDNKSEDFFFLNRPTSDIIIAVMINLIKNKLPKYVDATPFDIQILTPMRKGELGVERLNQVLQQALNPPAPDKKEKEYHQNIDRKSVV